jgi:hypothetical protein
MSDLAEVLSFTRGRLATVRSHLRASGSLTETIAAHPFDEERRRLQEAVIELQRTIRRARSSTVAHLVDHEGMSITAAARLLGVSRQAASQLYQESRPAPG